MNRRILFTILAVGSLALVATGCEKKNTDNNNTTETTTTTAAEKKLTCTITEDGDNGVKEEVKFAYTYKGDKLDKVILTSAAIYKDKYSEKDYKAAGDACKKYLESEHKGFTCNAQASGSRIYVTYSFTINDLSENGWKIAKESGVDEMKDLPYDNIKSTLTTAGYECK